MKNKKRIHYICSFCGKDRDQVRNLIAGPGGVYICDECIDSISKRGAEQQEQRSPTAHTKKASGMYRCSFCGKKQQQVLRLYGGPGDVKICSECIDLCQEIIEEELSVQSSERPGNC